MSSKRIASFSLGLFLLGGITLLAATKEEAEAAKYSKVLKSSGSGKEKITALQELGRLGQISTDLTKSSVPDIQKMLDDKDAKVRAAAAHAIGLIDPPNKPEVVSKLIKMLKEDANNDVKGGVAMGLGAMGADAKDAMGALRELREKAGKKDANARTYQNAMMQISGKKK